MIPSSIHTVCICGAGTMGSGIAQLFAQSGFSVILFDVNKSILEKATVHVNTQLQKLKESGKIETEALQSISAAIQYTNTLQHCTGDLVIEAIVENLDAKKKLFADLDEINRGRPSLFATNTSSLPVSSIATSLKDPSAFAGMHFFNPPVLMKLVEIIKGAQTSDAVTEQLTDVTSRLGKTAVLCKDVPGFIVNRVARPYYLEALQLMSVPGISYETIDSVMEATGFRMGPFRLMDMIGNDINLAVSTSLYEASGKPDRLRPSPLQEEKVKAGDLGKKSGKGYYEY